MLEPLPISVLLLARDEADRLEALLPNLAFAREVVVVVDAASRDTSSAVAERHGARVFVRPLEGFGAQRRFALDQCRSEWVLWLDADERLDDTAIAAMRAALASPGAVGYRWQRRTWFLGRVIRHCGWDREFVTRLFRRDRARFDEAVIHESVHIDGIVATLPGTIEHRSYERWDDYQDKLTRYAKAGALSARSAGRRASALDVVLRPPLRFVRMYLLQLGFLDGAHGAVLCALAAVSVALKYAQLWSLSRASKVPDRSESC